MTKQGTPKIIRDAVALEGAATAALRRYEEALEEVNGAYVPPPGKLDRLHRLLAQWQRLEAAREVKHVLALEAYPRDFPRHLEERRARRARRRAR
jgi:hypothetical protein